VPATRRGLMSISAEKEKELSKLNQNTPKVLVYNNAGLTVRQLCYYRASAEKTATACIQLQRYNRIGQLKCSIDQRLSTSYLKAISSVIPNQQQVNTLSGVLQTKNVDAGTRVIICDCQGQALWSWDSRGTEHEFEYDTLRRIKTVNEKEQGKTWFCSEYLRYGALNDPLGGNNGVGRLREHYDTAGRQVISEYSLLGQACQEERFFTKTDATINWISDFEENAKHLEGQSYHSRWNYNALGEVLWQKDAKGNDRGTVYDVAGQICETLLQLNNSEKKSLTAQRAYNASGQLQEEHLANGIAMRYGYEPTTQRLNEKAAKRLSDGVLLQSLHYTYDPVGNILTIEDKAQTEATDYYKNGKAEAISHYHYDSFYQLIMAEGIESEQASQQGKLPQAIVFGNKDANRLVNYRQTYQYDAGGNLYEIVQQNSHSATKLTIDTQSNRGIEKRESGPNLQESFDANGNLLYINTGQPLSWDIRNQLKEAVQVERENAISDKESYVYDGQGKRIQKTRVYLTEGQIHTERVRYLPGLELREHWQTDLQGDNRQDKERLLLIQAQGGGIPIKALHWELGQPNEIENDGLYYTLTDQIGSSQIELDKLGELVNYETYYPYGGTAIWAMKNQVISNYKYRRYSGKERDHSGLYYYGYRYYLPWLGRWLNPDPSGISQGLNLFEMVGNNPITFYDTDGRMLSDDEDGPPPPLPDNPPPLPSSAPPPLLISPLLASLPSSLQVNIPPTLSKSSFPWPPELISNGGHYIFYVKPGEATQQIAVIPANYHEIIDLLSENLALISSGKANQTTGNFGQEQQEILHQYTAASGKFNNPRKTVTSRIEALNAVLSMLPEQKTTVFRASPALLGIYGKKIQVHDIVSSDRFLSTTLHAGITTAFIENLLFNTEIENIFFIINSISGRYISDFSKYGTSEQEVLHTKNRNFRVDFIQEGKIKPLNTLIKTYNKSVKIKYVFLSEQAVARGTAKNIYTGE
jgi:insecticidal toxin complex protein TccC